MVPLTKWCNVSLHNCQVFEGKMLKKITHLAVLKGANGSCRAVSEFDMKNRDVTAAAQFTAGQPVTMFLLQRRHPAVNPSLPGLFRTKQNRYK